MIRSRCQQIHESKKPTKYFFSLEKVKYNIKHIRSLKHNGNHIFDPQNILDLQGSYFSQMYTETSSGNIMSHLDITSYLNKVNAPVISNDSKLLCDLPITIAEVKTAVRSMANNKTPGPDGISAEFYKMFWPDIGHTV